MTYLTKFDENGVRITSYPVDDDMTPEKRQELVQDGFIEITEEEWNYYIGNMGDGDNGTGYIRDMNTGRPVSAPPHTLSREEQLRNLDSSYAEQKAELVETYTNAQIRSDTETMSDITEEMNNLDMWYDEEYRRIMGQVNS